MPTRQVNNRYREINLSIPLNVSIELKKIAAKHGVQEIDVIRKFFQLGLVAVAGPLYVKKDDQFVELEIFEKAQPVTVD